MSQPPEGDECSPALLRPLLPSAFERWDESLPPGAERVTDAGEWAGALVLIESGVLEISCLTGGQCTFVAGDMVALGWLPLRSMRNPGPQPTILVAVRRRRGQAGQQRISTPNELRG